MRSLEAKREAGKPLRWSLIALALAALAIFVLPAAYRLGYSLTTHYITANDPSL